MKKSNKYIIMALLLIVILILFLKNINIKEYNLEKAEDTALTQLELNTLYNLKITYEDTNIEELDNKVHNYILKKQKQFIKEIKNMGNNEHKYDFILDAYTAEYNELIFVNIYQYSYTGGAHYDKEIATFIYDKNENRFLTIEDIILPEEFENFTMAAKELIYKYVEENNMEFDEEMINEGTLPKVDNFKNFYINDSGINIIFSPYQITSWADGELIITMPWEKANDFVKDEYVNNNIVSERKRRIKPKKRNLAKYQDKKVVAFTFDDGPNTKTTSVLLDRLPEFDAKVTFFVVGNRIAYNTDVLRRAYEEGNEIGSHSYSHRNLLKLNDEVILEEINKTNHAIEEVIGVSPIYFRPPYGSTNEHIKSITMMHTVCWNVDSLDWKLKDREKIKEEILTHAHDGAVILLHDLYEESVEGALLAMQALQEEGYAFLTLSELLEFKETTLDDYTLTFYGFKEKN